MSHWKASGLALFAATSLLGESTNSAHAQCNDGGAVEWGGGAVVNEGGLPGATVSIANGINDFGQAVGSSGPRLSSGAAGELSIWAASQASWIALPAASTTLGR